MGGGDSDPSLLSVNAVSHKHKNDISTHICQQICEANKQNSSAIIPCSVNGYPTKALLDTGAEVSLLSFDVYGKLQEKPPLSEKYRFTGVAKSMNTWMLKGLNIYFGNQSQKWNVLVASVKRSINYLFIYLGFYITFNTVQVISRWVVGRAEETST